MPDEDGYPTKEELKAIAEYDLLKSGADGFLELLESVWWMADWGFGLTGKNIKHLTLHTGGWSGNEDIIATLAGTMFWMVYWQKSLRGGHYYFKIIPIKKEK